MVSVNLNVTPESRKVRGESRVELVGEMSPEVGVWRNWKSGTGFFGYVLEDGGGGKRRGKGEFTQAISL